MPALDWNLILAALFGLVVVYLLARILLFPLKVCLRLGLNALFGVLLLIIFNVFGSLAGVGLGINVFTAFVVGMLGAPGLLVLFLLQRISS